ncbi:DUF2750 domain-containing protein [Patulibacter sp. NPDC049589]|uniref:DUF2750 domain-containing protein n=1 Tax=Patulibacter sp. NPDC049589 TaxID=3154731 RepID=UPI0034284AD1
MWSLADESGWVTLDDGDGNLLVPVWPHRVFVEAFGSGPADAAKPAALGTDEWFEDVSPALRKQGIAIAAFPTSDGLGAVIDLDRFDADLWQPWTRSSDCGRPCVASIGRSPSTLMRSTK